jgi:hypothetical protein
MTDDLIKLIPRSEDILLTVKQYRHKDSTTDINCQLVNIFKFRHMHDFLQLQIRLFEKNDLAFMPDKEKFVIGVTKYLPSDRVIFWRPFSYFTKFYVINSLFSP